MNRDQLAPIVFTREILYEQVWNTPSTKLARSYGMSDVALGKICKKHHIPKPPLGYWAKISHGQKVERTPLPNVEDETLKVIRIFKREATGNQSRSVDNIEPSERQFDGQSVQVPDRLTSPHALIERTLKSIRSSKREINGILRPADPHCLNVAVSKNSVHRAMLIMNTLIKALEDRGYDILLKEEENRAHTYVNVDGEEVEIELRELLEKRDLTPEEKKDRERFPWKYRFSDYSYAPSDRLLLQILEYVNGRKNWSDGKRQKIEDCLGSFLSSLVSAAAALRTRRLELKRWHMEWEEKERRRREQQEKTDNLHSMVESWRKSQDIRSFITAMEGTAINKYGPIDPLSNLGKWLSWASEYVDSIDPIVRSFSNNENDEDEIEQ